VFEISVRERKDLELQDFVLVTICLHSNRGYVRHPHGSLQDFLKKDMFEICYCFQVRKLRRREFSRAHPLSAAFVTSFKLGSSDEGNFHELTHCL